MISHRRKYGRAQATLEFALLLPIVFFLLYWVVIAFRTNHEASDQTIQEHAEALEKFNHGNSGEIIVEGETLVPGRFDEVIPPGASFDLGGSLKDLLPGLAGQLGLNALFSNVNWFQGEEWYVGFAKGSMASSVQQFLATGTVNEETAFWGGATGSLETWDAAGAFAELGPNWSHVAMGSALAFTRSEGDLSMAPGGALAGYFMSPSFSDWAEKYEVAAGAIRGGLSSAVNGIFNGEFDVQNVAVGAGMGAFNTRPVAKAFPMGGTWKNEPTAGASFRASSAFLGTVLSGGKTEDALFAAMDGAFYSPEATDVFNGRRGHDALQNAFAGVGYEVAKVYAEGAELEAVALGAFNGAMQGLSSYNEMRAILAGIETQRAIERELQNQDNIRQARHNVDVEGHGMTAVDAYVSNLAQQYNDIGLGLAGSGVGL